MFGWFLRQTIMYLLTRTLEIMVISILYPDFLDPLCLVAVLISIFEMYNVGIGL
ncbi:hypothetical protein Scep_021537 [Stephania cephalantha]|uniref:Uncharacterized protein n=1 Tax=Stephania cephalantha TaxID=152367 RepID=A0AAP0FBF0_9MAGN